MKAGRWSIPLGSLFGVPIRMHLTFLALVIWMIAWVSSSGEDVRIWSLILGLAVLCVILHELGHALAARFFSVSTREIVLHPLGGVAKLEGLPYGLPELVIALAGPGVNLVAAVLLFGTMQAAKVSWPYTGGGGDSAQVMAALFTTNLLLFAFNLLPAFPMDGGRALRGFLCMLLPEEHATRIAGGVGQTIALLLAVFALLGPVPDPILRLCFLSVAFFILIGANQELLLERMRRRMRGRTAGEAMMTRFETLKPQDSIEWATRLMLATHQRQFPVVDGWGRVAGVVDREVLLKALSTQGRETPVLDAMNREPLVVAPDMDLETVARTLQGSDAACAVVVDDDTLVGVLTLEKVFALLEIFERMSGD